MNDAEIIAHLRRCGIEAEPGIAPASIIVTDGVNARVPCEVYSRIVGYLRPVQNWNEGKQQEFTDRVPFAVPGSAYA